VARTGPRPLILAGAAAAAGGMFWFSRLTGHATYPGQLLGPMLVTSSGLGLLFVPLEVVVSMGYRLGWRCRGIHPGRGRGFPVVP
jgi:hypothetical protein